MRESLAVFGLQLSKIPARKTSFSKEPYEPIDPFSTYSPWNQDEMFLQTFESIRQSTLVDKYRCFELWSLIPQIRKLNAAILEVGVWRGGTGALIAKQAALCGITHPVYLCDTFTGVVKATNMDSTYRGGEHADTSQELVEALLMDLSINNVKILRGIFPDETGSLIENVSFAFCHIDVDVYQSAREITEWVWPRIVPGGVIVYDDFGFFGCDGVTRYVEEQLGEPDRAVIHNLNGHAVVIKTR